jgi:hypothetical protein
VPVTSAAALNALGYTASSVMSVLFGVGLLIDKQRRVRW